MPGFLYLRVWILSKPILEYPYLFFFCDWSSLSGKNENIFPAKQNESWACEQHGVGCVGRGGRNKQSMKWNAKTEGGEMGVYTQRLKWNAKTEGGGGI